MTRLSIFLASIFATGALAQGAPQPRPQPQYPQQQQPQYPQQQQQRQAQPAQRANQAPQGPQDLTVFAWFAELAGSCWKSEQRTDGKSDEQCYSSQFNRFMRGSIKFYQAGKVTAEGDSVFSFDAGAKVIIYSQWASNGSFGVGEARLDNGELVFQTRLPDGSEAPSRAVWRRIDADSYKVVRQRRNDRGWTDEGSVTYSRVKAAAPKG